MVKYVFVDNKFQICENLDTFLEISIFLSFEQKLAENGPFKRSAPYSHLNNKTKLLNF